MSTQKIQRTQERNFSAHHMLVRIAEDALRNAEENAVGSLYQTLIAMTFAALAVEALCNAIGERRIEGWKDDFESCSPNAKLRLIADSLDVPYRNDEDPWLSARWLIKFRNAVAHAKPEAVKETKIMSQKEHDRRLFDMPESKLEKSITLGNARKAIRVLDDLKQLLLPKVPDHQSDGLTLDSWSGTSRIYEDQQRSG